MGKPIEITKHVNAFLTAGSICISLLLFHLIHLGLHMVCNC